MMTYYCPVCKATIRAGHINAKQKVSEHMMEHKKDERDLITIAPRPWIQKRLREERYWDERWQV